MTEDKVDATAKPTENVWLWTDFEVVGHRSVTREQILAQDPPVTLGEPFAFDMEKHAVFEAWGKTVADKFGLAKVHVGTLRFLDGKAYLVLNVVEQQDAANHTFRAEPDKNIDVPEEVSALLEKHSALIQKNFDTQNFEALREEVRGIEEKDYYNTYPDSEEMSALVDEMRATFPPHRQALIEVLKHSRSTQARAHAATALNWSGDVLDSISQIYMLTDDPAVLVRNNISRFMLHYLQYHPDKAVRGAVIDSLLVQMTFPSHADRNKALYGLLALAQSAPADRGFIEQKGRAEIERIAKQSILDNVGGVAKQLLDLFDQPETKPVTNE